MMSAFRRSSEKVEEKDLEDFVLVERPLTRIHDEVSEVFQLGNCYGLDVYEVTVDQLQNYFSNGDLTARQYTMFCLENIRKTNQYLECVIETNPEAVDIAWALDQERRNGHVRGPLHGIPVLVKDNMATADRMETTAGSWALLGSKVPKDAHIVSLLRKAGAIILGKSNMDEWAGMRDHDYSTGWSARGGQCRSPYILSRSPNGSSSGSAVAISANLVPIAVGTETDCSVISPAMVNGVVGIKPTVGLTSRGGVIPISETQDSVGTFGRTVADAALMLDAIAGSDPDDKYSMDPDRRQPKSYFSCLTNRKSLKGAKFGLPMNRFWTTAPLRQRKVVELVLHLMKKAGAKIYEVDMPCAGERLPPNGEWDWERYGASNPSISEVTVCKIQTSYLMDAYLSQLTNTPIKTLADIVQYNDANTGSEGGLPNTLPAVPEGQPLFRDCIATKGIKTPEYHAALKHITSQCRENGIDAALKYKRTGEEEHGTTAQQQQQTLDALLFCDIKRGGIQIAAQAGYPVVTVPVGLDPDGVPVSLVLVHSAWQEDRLVRWASAVEDLLLHYTREEIRRHEGGRGRNGEQLQRSKRKGRVPPTFRNYLAKNIPADRCYEYPGVPGKSTSWQRQHSSFAQEDFGVNGTEFEEWERPRYLV